MSRRIKIDRRTIADRGTVIEVVNQCPALPAEFYADLRWVIREINQTAARLTEDMYSDYWNRLGAAIDLGSNAQTLDMWLEVLQGEDDAYCCTCSQAKQ
jgi:hypothetical protein